MSRRPNPVSETSDEGSTKRLVSLCVTDSHNWPVDSGTEAGLKCPSLESHREVWYHYGQGSTLGWWECFETGRKGDGKDGRATLTYIYLQERTGMGLCRSSRRSRELRLVGMSLRRD